ncbi:hypothetical protein [Streptomyces sp. KS 21]|uniref:hypothetical protein n=1 Tax=Streptomyces sp. KS 21 TaxID=2485150 RepID=UPI001062DFA5|nr:hypothetical protein [Streptomyces sp. KS 21]
MKTRCRAGEGAAAPGELAGGALCGAVLVDHLDLDGHTRAAERGEGGDPGALRARQLQAVRLPGGGERPRVPPLGDGDAVLGGRRGMRGAHRQEECGQDGERARQ